MHFSQKFERVLFKGIKKLLEIIKSVKLYFMRMLLKNFVIVLKSSWRRLVSVPFPIIYLNTLFLTYWRENLCKISVLKMQKR